MKVIILAIAVAALASMAVASFASAGVDRYQVPSSLTANVLNGTYVHTYDLTTNCDGTFTGVGGIDSLGLQEHINGTIDGSNITIHGVYATFNTPYTWDYSGPMRGGTFTDSLNQPNLTVSFTDTMSNFKNHGDYVRSQGGGDDAAHSCIGMPIQ